MDSSGVHLLLEHHRRASKIGARLGIIDGEPRVARTLQLCGVYDVFDHVHPHPGSHPPVRRHARRSVDALEQPQPLLDLSRHDAALAHHPGKASQRGGEPAHGPVAAAGGERAGQP